MYNPCMSEIVDVREPGEREPAPTPALHRLQDFVNTNDIEGGRDALETPELLRDWLRGRGLPGGGSTVSREAHRRTLAIREGLRALGHGNNGEALDDAAVARLNRAAAAVPLVATLGPTRWGLQPAGTDLGAFLAEILATAVAAMADGSWSRMKACRNDGCRWLFYDHSRNRSGTWCTMALCGSRMKARAYRARQRETTGT
jgi:predicted RNA-binding Zn ribbon-like protein